MADLIKCESCASEVSRKAAACPKCGHPIKSRHKSWGVGKWILAVIACVIVWRIALDIGQNMNEEVRSNASSVLPASIENLRHWTYETTTDSLKAAEKDYFAKVQSVNTFEFRSPYEGSQHATLVVRNSAQYGHDVYVQIERGQFLCVLDPCLVQVVFDNSQPSAFQVVRPKDLDSTYVFFADQKKILERLRKAARVKIQATFYLEGDNTLEFNVAGLDVSKLL